MKTQIIWKGKGNYEFWKGGEYDETPYPAEVRPAPFYRTSAIYCKSVADAVAQFRLRYYEVV